MRRRLLGNGERRFSIGSCLLPNLGVSGKAIARQTGSGGLWRNLSGWGWESRTMMRR